MDVRAVTSLDEFLGFPGEPESFREHSSELWSSGRSGPELCFVAEVAGERLGRVGFFSRPTLPEHVAAGLGDLPEREAFAYGLELPWQGAWRAVGAGLLETALRLSRPMLPAGPQLRINAEAHAHPDLRRAVAERAGFQLFQEKDGVHWTGNDVPPEVPERLRFRTMEELGQELVIETVARVAPGTLDRNDRYYSTRMSPRDWARVYVSLFDPPELTLVGFVDGEAVGFVAVSPFDEAATATISFIGVVQEQRGNGYVDDLLLARPTQLPARASGESCPTSTSRTFRCSQPWSAAGTALRTRRGTSGTTVRSRCKVPLT